MVKTRSLPMCQVMLRVVSSMLCPACAQYFACACAPKHGCVANLADLSLLSRASGRRHRRWGVWVRNMRVDI